MADDTDDLLHSLSNLISRDGLNRPLATEAADPDVAESTQYEDETFEMRLERAEREVNGLAK